MSEAVSVFDNDALGFLLQTRNLLDEVLETMDVLADKNVRWGEFLHYERFFARLFLNRFAFILRMFTQLFFQHLNRTTDT